MPLLEALLSKTRPEQRTAEPPDLTPYEGLPDGSRSGPVANTAPPRNPQGLSIPAFICRGRVLELDRPKREFEMDWEEEPEEAYEMPQLIEHDIDDILNDPVVLPKTRMRPPSPSVKLLGSSNDAKSAIDLVISQIASNDVTTSIQALTQVNPTATDFEFVGGLRVYIYDKV